MEIKYYCGLDFHKNVSQICVLDLEGKVIDEVRLDTDKVVQYLSNKRDYHIGIESSCGTFDMAAKLGSCGHKVTLINAVQFRALGIHGQKTDKKDSKAIATVLRLGCAPEVYQKTLYARRMKALLSSRDFIVKSRVGLISHIRAIMREFGIVIPQGVTAFMDQAEERLLQLDCEIIAGSLKVMIGQVEDLKIKEQEIEKRLEELTKNDERIAKLRTIPGVGPLGSIAFVAHIDDINRFENSRQVGSYIGLTPRENSSGNKRRLGSITKCGSEILRRYLIHGARSVIKTSKGSTKIQKWVDRLEKRSGKNIAATALANKNARICFAILKNGTSFGEFKKQAA